MKAPGEGDDGARVLWRPLLAPLLFGLALRAFLAGFTNTPSVDGAAFLLPLAADLLHGDLADWRWGTFPPLYPAMVAATRVIVGDLVLAGQVVSVLAGTLTILPGVLLVRRLLGEREGSWSAWLLAALPLACQYSARPQTEALYGLLFAWGALGFVHLLVGGPRPGPALLVGVMSALAAATRPEGAGLLVGGLVVILSVRPPAGAKGRWVAAAALLLPFLLLSTPGLLLNRRVTGRWTVSSKAGYIFRRNLQADPEDYYFRLTPDGERLLFETYILEPDEARPFDPFSIPPGRLASTWVASLGRMAAGFPRAFDPPLILLAILGLFLRPRPRWSREGKGIAILLLGYVIALTLFSSERRFWVPLLPLLVPLSARGLSAIPSKWRRIVAIATLLLLLPHAVRPVRDQGYSWQDSPERRLARLLPDGGEEAVLSEDGRVAIFAEANHVFLPKAEPQEVLAFARARGARFLAANPARLRERRPGLLEGLQPHLERIGEESGRGVTILLFRFR